MRKWRESNTNSYLFLQVPIPQQPLRKKHLQLLHEKIFGVIDADKRADDIARLVRSEICEATAMSVVAASEFLSHLAQHPQVLVPNLGQNNLPPRHFVAAVLDHFHPPMTPRFPHLQLDSRQYFGWCRAAPYEG